MTNQRTRKTQEHYTQLQHPFCHLGFTIYLLIHFEIAFRYADLASLQLCMKARLTLMSEILLLSLQNAEIKDFYLTISFFLESSVLEYFILVAIYLKNVMNYI